MAEPKRLGRPPKPKAPWKPPDLSSYRLLRQRFAVALRDARIRLELSSREAAERALVTHATWLRAEDPEGYAYNPRLSELLMMAVAVELDLGAAFRDPFIGPPADPW
jgi:hypothetical protein